MQTTKHPDTLRTAIRRYKAATKAMLQKEGSPDHIFSPYGERQSAAESALKHQIEVRGLKGVRIGDELVIAIDDADVEFSMILTIPAAKVVTID